MRIQAVIMMGIVGAMGVWALSSCSTAPVTVKETNLVPYTIVNKNSIPQSLTGKKGDPAEGRKLAINKRKGNCLACHELPIPEEQFHGKIGPNLHNVGSKYSEGILRLRLVNPKVVKPDSVMPAFYRVDGLNIVRKDLIGKPMLSAEEIEDLVAYLTSIK
ncbi:MAG: sulfur oxidation c-type cytochrome SoxX [Deltaproteobacteria bacterium]|nr:sulfur oxidation c-type cytochrome SoxX [Deltaproteobacteria bacterium]